MTFLCVCVYATGKFILLNILLSVYKFISQTITRLSTFNNSTKPLLCSWCAFVLCVPSSLLFSFHGNQSHPKKKEKLTKISQMKHTFFLFHVWTWSCVIIVYKLFSIPFELYSPLCVCMWVWVSPFGLICENVRAASSRTIHPHSHTHTHTDTYIKMCIIFCVYSRRFSWDSFTVRLK